MKKLSTEKGKAHNTLFIASSVQFVLSLAQQSLVLRRHVKLSTELHAFLPVTCPDIAGTNSSVWCLIVQALSNDSATPISLPWCLFTRAAFQLFKMQTSGLNKWRKHSANVACTLKLFTRNYDCSRTWEGKKSESTACIILAHRGHGQEVRKLGSAKRLFSVESTLWWCMWNDTLLFKGSKQEYFPSTKPTVGLQSMLCMYVSMPAVGRI